MVLFRELSGKLVKTEAELNERVAEKEKEGWEVVDMQLSRSSFGHAPIIVIRLSRESN